MSIAEMFVIIAAVVILFVVRWQAKKLSNTYRFYVSIVAAILLVGLVWLDSSSTKFFPQIALTVLALASVVRSYKDLQKEKSEIK